MIPRARRRSSSIISRRYAAPGFLSHGLVVMLIEVHADDCTESISYADVHPRVSELRPDVRSPGLSCGSRTGTHLASQ